MWRGTTRARPIRTGSFFVGLGPHRQRMVIYPISRPDAEGLAMVSWIAEVTHDDPAAHAMYPTGSNVASQAIIDARTRTIAGDARVAL